MDIALERENIPEMLHFINAELMKDSGGSKQPILPLMKEHFISRYPFVHEYGEVIYRFANYMAVIQAQALQLFKESCNRMFVDPAQRQIAYEDEYNKLVENLKLQHEVLPKEEDVFLITKYDDEKRPLHGRLVSNLNGLALNFSLERQYWKYLSYYKVINGEYKEYLNDPSVEYYQKFMLVRDKYGKGQPYPDFLSAHTGGIFPNTNWLSSPSGKGCSFVFDPEYPEYGRALPAVDLCAWPNLQSVTFLPYDIDHSINGNSFFLRTWTTPEPPKPYQILLEYKTMKGEAIYLSGYGTNSGNPLEVELITGIQIKLISNPKNTHVEYSVYVTGSGWTPYVRDYALAGSTDITKPIEAVRIRLVNLPEFSVIYETFQRPTGYYTASDDQIGGEIGKGKGLYMYRIRAFKKDRLESLLSE